MTSNPDPIPVHPDQLTLTADPAGPVGRPWPTHEVDQVAATAGPAWLDLAVEAVATYANAAGQPFTVADVLDPIIEHAGEPHDRRAVGSALRTASTRGHIVRTGQLRPGGHDRHDRPVTEWIARTAYTDRPALVARTTHDVDALIAEANANAAGPPTATELRRIATRLASTLPAKAPTFAAIAALDRLAHTLDADNVDAALEAKLAR